MIISPFEYTMYKATYISTLSTLMPHAVVASSRLVCRIRLFQKYV